MNNISLTELIAANTTSICFSFVCKKPWPIVFLLWTSLSFTVTSKLPVVVESFLEITWTFSGNFFRINCFAALNFGAYPHPPHHWMPTCTCPGAVLLSINVVLGFSVLHSSLSSLAEQTPVSCVYLNCKKLCLLTKWQTHCPSLVLELLCWAPQL